MGCRHSSVDSSVPTILLPQVQVPSTPSMLFSFIVSVLYLSCEKNENKQKEAGFGPFKENKKLTEHLKSCIKTLPGFYGSCIKVKLVL